MNMCKCQEPKSRTTGGRGSRQKQTLCGGGLFPLFLTLMSLHTCSYMNTEKKNEIKSYNKHTQNSFIHIFLYLLDGSHFERN